MLALFFVFFVVIPASLLHPSRDEIMQPAMIWQGFHFQWLRRELGFETPHRLGSFASYISNVTSTCSTPRRGDGTCSALGTYHVQFTPGVSGDYAYPSVYYQAVTSTDASEIVIAVGNTTFSFRDNSTAEPVLHADTSRYVNITIALSDSLSSPSRSQLLLRGFQVDMKCIVTADHPCNSNAIWPYHFNLSVAQDCTLLAQQKVVVCPLYFGLGRGWTPSHGGGKDYNYQMEYNVTVFYTRVTYSVQSGCTLQKQRLVQRTNIYDTPVTGRETLANTSAAKESVLLGLTEFSWSLTPTDGYLNRGRYLEELVFIAQPITQSETEISYNWMMGYRDPFLTTSLGVAAIIAPMENMVVSDSRMANGSVCMDNKDIFTFDCSKFGLKSHTQDTVNIHATLNTLL